MTRGAPVGVAVRPPVVEPPAAWAPPAVVLLPDEMPVPVELVPGPSPAVDPPGPVERPPGPVEVVPVPAGPTPVPPTAAPGTAPWPPLAATTASWLIRVPHAAENSARAVARPADASRRRDPRARMAG